METKKQQNIKDQGIKISSIKGVNDVLPPETVIWNIIESEAKAIFTTFGYSEIKIPIFEETRLFSRSIGDGTDIVEKEMYTFTDKKGLGITLRPEGTASVVRALIEHKLYAQSSINKLYYFGPMFRYERPQAGRSRQFYQIGAEAFGVSHPGQDAELVNLIVLLFDRLKVSSYTVNVNSVGCPQCRSEYKKSLQDFLQDKLGNLCEDCKCRIQRNPFRILDCKNELCKAQLVSAPIIEEYLCQPCKDHFKKFQDYLRLLDIPFTVNPHLVRGLDYYTKTTFEINSEILGAQNAIAGGGRYDNLVSQFSGPDTPATGFAIGVERLFLAIKDNYRFSYPPDTLIYIVALGEDAQRKAFQFQAELRKRGIKTEIDAEGKSIKAQLRSANRYKARFSLIIGENELIKQKVLLKDMKTSEQEEVEISRAVEVVLKKGGF
ncbi:MAG: histidine--tRNA ligase [bacterium]